MSTDDYTSKVFNAPTQRLDQITATVLRHVGDRARPLRVLDIGCGSGQQLFDLARALPRAQLIGVDISVPNIERAEQERLKSEFSDRLSFVAGDYLALESAPFDVIVSYSTLHLIPGSTEGLFSKIASDLAAGGVLVFAIPRECAVDAPLLAVRRTFRALRSRLTDAIVLKAGVALHGRELSEEMVRERVEYMYVLPHRFAGRRLNEWLGRECGLRLLEQYHLPRASVAQLQHSMNVFSRAGTPAAEGGGAT